MQILPFARFLSERSFAPSFHLTCFHFFSIKGDYTTGFPKQFWSEYRLTIIPDIPEYYRKYPDLLQFIAAQKMPWKESITLSGEIGEYIVMARQAADETWLVGARKSMYDPEKNCWKAFETELKFIKNHLSPS